MSRLFALNDTITSDDWYTPAWIFDGMALTFDLDVCAPVDGPLHVPARRWYSESDDGLLQPWEGLVWCNPPYSDPAPWCRKWAVHDGGGCLLVRADLSSGGPFVAWSNATSVFVPERRLQFVNGAGGASGAVNFSSVLLGRGAQADAGLHRLAATFGGTARILRAAA